MITLSLEFLHYSLISCYTRNLRLFVCGSSLLGIQSQWTRKRLVIKTFPFSCCLYSRFIHILTMLLDLTRWEDEVKEIDWRKEYCESIEYLVPQTEPSASLLYSFLSFSSLLVFGKLMINHEPLVTSSGHLLGVELVLLSIFQEVNNEVVVFLWR